MKRLKISSDDSTEIVLLKVLLNGRLAHLAVLDDKERIYSQMVESVGVTEKREFYVTLSEVYHLQRESLEVEIASMLVTLQIRCPSLEWEEEIAINDLNNLGKLICSIKA